MCIYLICSIHMKETQISHCTFCDPSVRLQKQRQASGHAIFPKLSQLCAVLRSLKMGALTCQQCHPLESRESSSIQSVLMHACLMLTQSPDRIPETPVRDSLNTFYVFHARFYFVSWPPLSCWMLLK